MSKSSLFAVLEHWCENSRSIEAALIHALLRAVPEESLPDVEKSLASALVRSGWHRRRVKAVKDEAAPRHADEFADLGEEAHLQAALQVIIRERRPSADILQRALNISGEEATHILDVLEKRGYVGPQPEHGYRKILFHRGKSSFEPHGDQ